MTVLNGANIADVWYLPGGDDAEEILSKGQNLSQVLLEKGLAQPVEY